MRVEGTRTYMYYECSSRAYWCASRLVRRLGQPPLHTKTVYKKGQLVAFSIDPANPSRNCKRGVIAITQANHKV